jgi:hypothetical protein
LHTQRFTADVLAPDHVNCGRALSSLQNRNFIDVVRQRYARGLDERGREVPAFVNRRAEIWAEMKRALADRFSLPDNDALQGDLASVGFSYRSDGALVLESKADLRKRGVNSPDLADACALCFCENDGFVRSSFNQDLRKRYGHAYY